MASKQLLAATVLALATTPTFAVYKCKDAAGRTVFQERACETTGSKGAQIDVRPAAGPAPAAPTANAANAAPSADQASAPQTEAERLRGKSERLRKENRLGALKYLDIPSAQARIRGASNQCDARMKAVRSQKAYANNNLAGATWEQSISTEMQAIATQCGAEQTRLSSELDRLLTEKRMLEDELRR